MKNKNGTLSGPGPRTRFETSLELLAQRRAEIPERVDKRASEKHLVAGIIGWSSG